MQLAKEVPEFKKSQWMRQADETPNSFYSALRIIMLYCWENADRLAVKLASVCILVSLEVA
jgi:hypothetical protein